MSTKKSMEKFVGGVLDDLLSQGPVSVEVHTRIKELIGDLDFVLGYCIGKLMAAAKSPEEVRGLLLGFVDSGEALFK